MGLWSDWQAARDRRRRVDQYLARVLHTPSAADIAWLEAGGAPHAVAARELDFARRAVGLIVSERDALDDLTAADVAHQLAPAIAAEARRDPEAGRLWAERWRAYSATLAVRGSTDGPAVRLARVLLAGAGVDAPSDALLQRATRHVVDARTDLNEVLRATFGSVSLPEDVRPSAMRQ